MHLGKGAAAMKADDSALLCSNWEVDALRRAPHQPGPVNGVGHAPLEGLHQPDELLRVVFQVGVLGDDDVARDVGEACSQRGPLPAVPLVVHHPESIPPPPFPIPEPLTGSVRRAVVHQDDLFLQLQGHDLPEDLLDGFALVVDGHDDGKLHAVTLIGKGTRRSRRPRKDPMEGPTHRIARSWVIARGNPR